MPTIAQHFSLNKTQAELDFIDVNPAEDIALFIDPFAISIRPDRFCQQCHTTINAYFQRIVDKIRAQDNAGAYEQLSFLREPNETKLGFSTGRPQGAGIGGQQAMQLFKALQNSTAVQTGFINSLEECELLIEGIGRDKISDLTTNVIRKHLAEYTKEQCVLHGIPTSSMPLPPYYDVANDRWIPDYFQLPVVNRRPILMVPKLIARYDPSYSSVNYYDEFVLKYLEAEALSSRSSLVRSLKNGARRVYKKDLKAQFPFSKTFLYEFSRNHPDVLKEYRDQLRNMEKAGRLNFVNPGDESVIAQALAKALAAIPTGTDDASQYHRLMIGVSEFLFFPSLISPKLEQEIHQGRKRIDIVMENAATYGIFERLVRIRRLPCSFVMQECKNYTSDVNNPELDQLAGRFSQHRGRFGMLFCRHFDDRPRFIERCRDTFKDNRGLIVPIDDKTVLTMLALIQRGERDKVDDVIDDLVNEVWMS